MKNAIDFSGMTEKYFNYCFGRKNLDKKTIKSYRIDLRQCKHCFNKVASKEESCSIIDL